MILETHADSPPWPSAAAEPPSVLGASAAAAADPPGLQTEPSSQLYSGPEMTDRTNTHG